MTSETAEDREPTSSDDLEQTPEFIITGETDELTRPNTEEKPHQSHDSEKAQNTTEETQNHPDEKPRHADYGHNRGPRENRGRGKGGKGSIDLPPPSPVLFLPNMSQHANERDLMDLSKRCPGKVRKTFMYMSTSAHHGFLECETVDDSSRILDWINNSYIEVRGKRIFAEFSRRKTVEDRMTYEHRQTMRKGDSGPYRKDEDTYRQPSRRDDKEDNRYRHAAPYRDDRQTAPAPYRDDRQGRSGRYEEFRRRSRSPPSGRRSPPRYPPRYEEDYYRRPPMEPQRRELPSYDYHRAPAPARYEEPTYHRGREYDEYQPRQPPAYQTGGYEMPPTAAYRPYEEYPRTGGSVPPAGYPRYQEPAAQPASYPPYQEPYAPYPSSGQPKPQPAGVSHPLLSIHSATASSGGMPPVRTTAIGTRAIAPPQHHLPYPYK